MVSFNQIDNNTLLEDDRVLLRPLQKEDYDNLLNFSLNEPDLWKYSLVQPIGEEGLKNYLKIADDERTKKTEFSFIVFDKKSNEYAGSTRFYDINYAFQTLQLGYTLYGKKFQGTGLNKHCKFLLLRYAFEVLDMIRVEFRADAKNERSVAAMKNIGCKVDGILRSNMPTIDNSVRRDSIVLSILKNEGLLE